jgi:hypothetical protein
VDALARTQVKWTSFDHLAFCSIESPATLHGFYDGDDAVSEAFSQKSLYEVVFSRNLVVPSNFRGPIGDGQIMEVCIKSIANGARPIGNLEFIDPVPLAVCPHGIMMLHLGDIAGNDHAIQAVQGLKVTEGSAVQGFLHGAGLWFCISPRNFGSGAARLATSIIYILTCMNNKQWLGVMLMLFGSVALILILLISWAFKDGMGPDSVESSGLEAIGKLFTGPLVAVYSMLLCTIASGFLVYKKCG